MNFIRKNLFGTVAKIIMIVFFFFITTWLLVFPSHSLSKAPVQGGNALLNLKARNDRPGPVEVRIEGWDVRNRPTINTILGWDGDNNIFSNKPLEIPKTTRVLRFTFINDLPNEPVSDDLGRNAYIDYFYVNNVFYEAQNWTRTGGTELNSPGCKKKIIDNRTLADCGNQRDWVEYVLHPGNPVESGNTERPSLSFSISTSLQPAVPDIPGFDEGTPRSLAAVIDSKGHQADFVENELWLSTDDQNELDAFLTRWHGEVVSAFNPTGFKPQYLIRFDTTLADASRLMEDLIILDPYSHGDHWVSSESGLRLIAAGARETAMGLEIGINWVGRGSDDTFRDHISNEAPSGTGGYDPNVFTWPSHNVGSVQDIGVTGAWRALELAGRLDNRVGIAILDMGFSVDATGSDMPRNWMAYSNVPFVNPIETDNLLDCGGNPCPWHGTNVLSAAMAIPDNDYGSAGPAGPIARPIMIYTLYDFFTSMAALNDSIGLGAKIANMSYSAPVPSVLAWSVYPFEAATAFHRYVNDVLLFAAAGNDGEDVDAVDCLDTVIFGTYCWEEAWHTPCENAGVICVGGLGWNDTGKAGGSNYGHEHVDIFAPYTLWLGPDPASPVNMVQMKNGTSFSSPYAAGVTALIWAANPSLSADDVERILYDNALRVWDRWGHRRNIKARDAVLEAIGGTATPFIKILSPIQGGNYSAFISFDADAEDLEDGFINSSISWISSIDGIIGSGSSFSRRLSFGTHMITATATDSDSNVSSDSVIINIINEPPTVSISSVNPANPYQGQMITLAGTSYDPNIPGSLSDTQVGWYLDSSPLAFATGHSATIAGGTLNAGSHTITFKGTDGVNTTTDTVAVEVMEDPADNIPPTAIITSPNNGDKIPPDQYDETTGKRYADVSLCGFGEDPEDGRIMSPSQVTWYGRKDLESTFQELATGGDTGPGSCPVVRLYMEGERTTHIIRLVVTDSDGALGEQEITISIFMVL